MRWTLVLLALWLTACASLQSVSSGQIGCHESEITITEDSPGWGSRTWVAECHGKRYFCSAHGGGEGSTAQVSCKEDVGGDDDDDEDEESEGEGEDDNEATDEEEEEPPKKAHPKGGCEYDTQCKGDRICVKGECTSPAPGEGDKNAEPQDSDAAEQ